MLGKQDWSYISGARQLARGAHEADEDITSLRFSADNNTLLSRSEDATLKVSSNSFTYSEGISCGHRFIIAYVSLSCRSSWFSVFLIASTSRGHIAREWAGFEDDVIWSALCRCGMQGS